MPNINFDIKVPWKKNYSERESVKSGVLKLTTVPNYLVSITNFGRRFILSFTQPLTSPTKVILLSYCINKGKVV